MTWGPDRDELEKRFGLLNKQGRRRKNESEGSRDQSRTVKEQERIVEDEPYSGVNSEEHS
jgi:ABC-type Na+ transport system ATPase subunit NatA